MNNEAPERIWLIQKEISGHLTWIQTSGHNADDVQYRRVDPPAAPDERDKQLAHQIVMSGHSRYFDPTLIDTFAALLATVRAEVWDAAIDVAKAELVPDAAEGSIDEDFNAATNDVIRALESARTGKVEE